jgi:hypothetical protein
VNHKRVLRLYREEGLSLRQKKPRRRRSAARREGRPAPQAPNELWAMDFMHDTLASGRAMRVLTAIDVYTWECLALEPAPAFSGADVAKIMHAAGVERGKLPARIKVDNGTEFTSKSLDAWAYWNQLELDLFPPGQAGRQCTHRGLQQHRPARVPLATLVFKHRGRPQDPRRVAEGVQRGPAPRGFGPRGSSPISGWNLEEPEPNRSSKVAELVDRKRGEEPLTWTVSLQAVANWGGAHEERRQLERSAMQFASTGVKLLIRIERQRGRTSRAKGRRVPA